MTRLFAPLVPAFGLIGCAEDLTAVTATWTSTWDGWTKTLADAKKAGDDLSAKAKALPAPADADATGEDLKGKLDAALEARKNAVATADQLSVELKGTVEAAMQGKKIAPVQAAIDAAKPKFDEAAAKISAAATAAGSAFDALKAHLDAEAAKAAAAAADPALQDPTEARTQDGSASFPFTFTDKNALDEAASAAVIERFVKFMGTCDALKVELTGTADDEKAGKARADALKKALANKVPAARIAKTAGAAGDGAVTAKVVAPCPAAG